MPDAPAARPAASLPGPAFGGSGAVAAAHPLASGAAVATYSRGGNAVDAAIAAQAVLAVAAPDACGLGGDALFLVAEPDASAADRIRITAVNGTGAAAADPHGPAPDPARPGTTVTVPGQVAAWETLAERFGALPLRALLEPAVRLAEQGCRVDRALAQALGTQRRRLDRGGAAGWVLAQARAGDRPAQRELAATLRAIAEHGAAAFHEGPLADALCATVRRCGGALRPADLAAHRTVVAEPLWVPWAGGRVAVQPPASQGVLLALALAHLDVAPPPAERLDHVAVETTEAAFAHRDRVTADGGALLAETLAVDPERAAGRGGPRAYLHTAGVATADAGGRVVASLASVFDDFGSGCYVPEGGFVLNNRAEGFTAAPNDFRPGARPVHTLAPAMVVADGRVTGLATPGADGQVQTLLQVLAHRRWSGRSLAEAIDAPRWRSEGGRLLLERSHRGGPALRDRGHQVAVVDDGDPRMGAVVAAGLEPDGPFAVADWRRGTTTAVL